MGTKRTALSSVTRLVMGLAGFVAVMTTVNMEVKGKAVPVLI
jgi:hypothetical protein